MAVNPNATYEPEDHKRESIELATPTKIGKVKIIDVLTSTAYKAGEALSAHMGYVLAQIGNASQYGRVKLSDNYTASAGAAADGVGASSAAVAAAYSALNSKIGSAQTSANTAQSTANSAVNLANNAQSSANTANYNISVLDVIRFKHSNWYTDEVYGLTVYKFEGVDTGAYHLPWTHCVLIKMMESATRGAALAIRWDSGGTANLWTAYLHDDTGARAWSGWYEK